jgi:hypothetical protein
MINCGAKNIKKMMQSDHAIWSRIMIAECRTMSGEMLMSDRRKEAQEESSH